MATSRKKSSPRAPSSPGAKSRPAAGRQSSGRRPADTQARKPRSAGPVNPDSMPAEVIEFITAVDDYKRKHGRPFPSWSEIFEVLKGLGYRKVS